MKSVLFALLLFSGALSFAQSQPFYYFSNGVNPDGKEVHVLKGYQPPAMGGYYMTPAYNDLFLPPRGADEFILPDSAYFYKQKKVSQVKITDNGATPRFILDLDHEGRPVKTTRFTDLLRESSFFYDQQGRNNLKVNTFGRNGIVLRIDSIFHSYQKKIINDTTYTYTTVTTRIYKSGAFMNDQNTFYNKAYCMVKLKEETNSITAAIYGNDRIVLRKKLKCNYPANTFCFSSEVMDVEDFHCTFQQSPVNPGEKSLETYAPELYERGKPKYSTLPCEQFMEPRFMRTSWVCGSGLQRAHEFQMMQQNTHYSYSANSSQMHDTCYVSSLGGAKSPLYIFSYTYF